MYSYDQKTAEASRNLDGALISPPSHLSPQFLVQNKLPVYVLTAIPPQSNLTFTIKQGGGLPGSALRIPRQKTPFCVTGEVPHEMLARGGKDVWTAIDKGMLVLVWPSDAETMLHGRTAEQERAQLSKWSTLNVEKSPELAAHENILRKAKVAEENAESEAAAEEQQEIVNARVMDIVARSRAGEVKLDKAVAEFENLADTMTERDYQYAIANVRGGKLREWLQGALAKGAAPSPKKAEAKAAKKAAKGSVLDDAEPEMTDEEREAEAQAETEARQRQRING